MLQLLGRKKMNVSYPSPYRQKQFFDLLVTTPLVICKVLNQCDYSGVHIKTGCFCLLHFSALLWVDGEKTPVDLRQMIVLNTKYFHINKSLHNDNAFIEVITLMALIIGKITNPISPKSL